MKTDLLFSCYTPKAGCDHEREVLIPLKLVEKPKTGLSPLARAGNRNSAFLKHHIYLLTQVLGRRESSRGPRQRLFTATPWLVVQQG